MKRFNIPINSELLTQICQGELKGKISSVLCKVGEPEEQVPPEIKPPEGFGDDFKPDKL